MVDWQKKLVSVFAKGKKFELPVVPFSHKSMHILVNSWPGRTMRGDTCCANVDSNAANVVADVASDVADMSADRKSVVRSRPRRPAQATKR